MRLPLLLTICATCSFLTFLSDASADETKRPNVLFIAVDDLRPELGCYGCESIKSPNIDALGRTGLIFNRAYCQQAVCNPSRASLLTGLRPDTLRVWDLITNSRDTMPRAVTLPQHFKQHGYRTVGMGKIYHNTFPDQKSWSIPKPPVRDTAMYSDESLQRWNQYRRQMREAGKSDAAINRMRGPATDDEDVADSRRHDGKLCDMALEHMRELADRNEPFFLAVGFFQPHLPWTPPKKYWDMYDPTKIPEATNQFLPRNMPSVAFSTRSKGGMYELCDYFDFADAPSPFDGSLTEAQRRRLKHGYYAAVSFIDAQVGRLTAELARLELDDDTIVILWGDHGWKLGEHNGWCKQTNYEIDTRVPMIIRVPGAQSCGTKTDALVEFVDIYPTLCALADLPIPDTLEGDSLAGLLDRSTQQIRTSAASQFPRLQDGRRYMGYTIRTDRYRLVLWIDRETFETTDLELYDQQLDPQENTNIAGRPENATLIAKLEAELWQRFDRPTVPFSQIKLPRSNHPIRPVLIIENRLDEPVVVHWISPEGKEIVASRLAPHAHGSINTTIGHRFIARGTESRFEQHLESRSKQQTVVLKAEVQSN